MATWSRLWLCASLSIRVVNGCDPTYYLAKSGFLPRILWSSCLNSWLHCPPPPPPMISVSTAAFCLFFVLISKLLEDVHKYELKAPSSVNFSCSFGFNYLFDALKLGWNVMIFSWDWLTIDLARVSMGPRYPRFHRLIITTKTWQSSNSLFTVQRTFAAAICLTDLNFSLDRVF